MVAKELAKFTNDQERLDYVNNMLKRFRLNAEMRPSEEWASEHGEGTAQFQIGRERMKRSAKQLFRFRGTRCGVDFDYTSKLSAAVN